MKKYTFFTCLLLSFYSITFAWNSKYITNNEIHLSKETSKLELQIDLPLLDNMKNNKEILQNIQSYIKNFKNETNNFEYISDAWKYNLTFSWEIIKSNNFINYELTIYEFAWGAHGNTTTQTFNFNINGEKISLQDFVGLDTLSDAAQKYYKQQLNNGELNSDNEWIEEWLAPNNENFKNFLIKECNTQSCTLEFIFWQYQIAPYAEWIKRWEVDVHSL